MPRWIGPQRGNLQLHEVLGGSGDNIQQIEKHNSQTQWSIQQQVKR